LVCYSSAHSPRGGLVEKLGKLFSDEMLAKTKIAKDLLYSGVAQITDSFHEEVDWVHLFDDASKIDVFFAYGATWRNRHSEKLKSFVRREHSRLRIVLPDLSDPQTTAELARRFDTPQATLVTYIRDAEEFFVSLRTSCGVGTVVELWRYPGCPLFSLYRFDNSMVFTIYTHRRTRHPIPPFVCRNTGTLFGFLYEEFQAMISGDRPLARRYDGETTADPMQPGHQPTQLT
jgi:hypothetical protein